MILLINGMILLINGTILLINGAILLLNGTILLSKQRDSIHPLGREGNAMRSNPPAVAIPPRVGAMRLSPPVEAIPLPSARHPASYGFLQTYLVNIL